MAGAPGKQRLPKPLGRRLLITWTALIWLGWLLSGELAGATGIVLELAAGLIPPPWPAGGAALKSAAGAALGAGTVFLAIRLFGHILVSFTTGGAGEGFIALGAGLSLLAGLVQALGWLGLTRPELLAAATVGLAVLSMAIRPRRNRPSSPAATPLSLRLFCAAAAAAVLLAALAPAAAWDEIVYHLRVPSLYLLAGKIHPVPGIFPSYFPFTGETLMLLAANLGGEPAARLLHAAMWLTCGAAAAGLGLRLLGAQASPWARALLLSLPLGMVLASRAYVEFFLVLPLLGALAALSGPAGASRRNTALAGWLAGTLCGVKYLGSPVCLLLLFLAWKRRLPVIFAAAAAAAGGYWFIRNALWTGNPVYPLIWGGPHWTPLDMTGWKTDAMAFDLGLFRLLAFPWQMVAGLSADGGGSPLVASNLPLPVLAGTATAAPLWVLAGLMTLLWWISSPLPRYLLPALCLFCIGVAGAVCGQGLSAQAGRWMRMVALAGLAGSLACGLRNIQIGTWPYEAALGKLTAREYSIAYFRPEGYAETIEELKRRVPARGRVYFLGHVHSHGLPRRSWFEFLYLRPPLYWWLEGALNSERIRIRARQAGLSHIVYHPLGAKAILAENPERMEWTPAKLASYERFWRRHVRETSRIREWVIYRIDREPDGAAPVFPLGVPGTEGAGRS